MIAKVLAGLLAAALATGVGVYVAFAGGVTGSAESASTESLPVSEGACCMKAMQASCCAKSEQSAANCAKSDALAACAGTASFAVTATAPTLGCCDE
jgi:hypothetical protein